MNSSYKLPNMEHKFKIQVLGEESRINWAGDFVYRRPTLSERAMIDVMRSKLNGDLRTIDPDTNAYNEALSHLRFTLKEYPTWWKECDLGGSLYDGNVILDIYEKVMTFEASWREKTFGEPKGVSDELQSTVAEASTPI